MKSCASGTTGLAQKPNLTEKNEAERLNLGKRRRKPRKSKRKKYKIYGKMTDECPISTFPLLTGNTCKCGFYFAKLSHRKAARVRLSVCCCFVFVRETTRVPKAPLLVLADVSEPCSDRPSPPHTVRPRAGFHCHCMEVTRRQPAICGI